MNHFLNWIEILFNWLEIFNNKYATGVQALTPFVIGIFSFLAYRIFKLSISKPANAEESDASSEVSPIFWTFGKKYKILAVHKFKKSDDVSGYTHISQNSRPDQWNELINIKSFLNLRFQIMPKNTNDILTIIISRNAKEKWKSINFNK